MDKKTIIDITFSVVTEYWKNKIMQAQEIQTNAFLGTLDKMPLSSTEKSYYRAMYLKEFQKGLEKSLNPEQQAKFRKEIDEKIKD